MKSDGFTPIDSGHLDGAQYNSLNRTMLVRFKNGYVYKVHSVYPDDHKAFMDADSQGKHFHEHIKTNHHIERVK